MKKLLKANATNIILFAVLTFGISLFISIVPAAIRTSTNFSETLKISIPVAIAFLILFWITGFYILTEMLKTRNAIIKKFSLKENEFTKVIVSDSLLFPFESSILIDAIKLISNGTFDIESVVNIEEDNLILPYDNITPACYTLVKIFKELEGNFYLFLDDNYDIFLALKTKENELLSTTKLNSEKIFKDVLNGFSTVDDED